MRPRRIDAFELFLSFVAAAAVDDGVERTVGVEGVGGDVVEGGVARVGEGGDP